MSAETDIAALKEQVAVLDKRTTDAVHERRKLADELRAHDRKCIDRWARLDVKMAILTWVASAAASGTFALVGKAVWELIK